jgi:beta-carotene hydroxylase
VIGAFFAAMTGFSAVGYGIAHWAHHRFTNQASDPDARIYSRFRTFWTRLLFARAAGIRAHAANLLKVARGSPLRLGYPPPLSARGQQGLAWLNIAFLAFWLATYAALAVFHPGAVLIAIVLPVMVGMQLSGLRAYIEHAGTGLGTFRDTRTCAARAYGWLLFGNNYHLEHHLYPGVPCYRLRAVHRLLAADGYFARCDSPMETTLLGPLVHTTSVSQYPSPAFGDLSDDPFHPTLEPHASAA